MTKIRIERNSEWNNKAREIGIYIDGEKAGTIDDGKTQEFEVESGKHEIYAKIDWCRSQKIELNTAENDLATLKLTGFKYGTWLLPLMLGFSVMYYLLTYVFDIKLIHIVWIPVIVLLYPTYFITFGKNRYLILTQK
ncbi:hypothetical protein ADIWIN_0430 [Winogradskyella psychrotolerans RS-3]|uniref:PEGA domain-containing protein n=1 Tax=Winogradskyella psychrotolerans RS-3 TaxID=641526 RepID=S7VW72_9FLAO|nr:hypothetical protein [Winogradskyella psychrotolerans]EPR74530.1 hypothetical protein ADIWIN_0430 [Winogradskyella psychrotolerans RS-3]